MIGDPKRMMNELQKSEAGVKESHEDALVGQKSPILGNSDLKDGIIIQHLDEIAIEEISLTEGDNQSSGCIKKITESRKQVLIGYAFIKTKITTSWNLKTAEIRLALNNVYFM
jgi:hypothetical protein